MAHLVEAIDRLVSDEYRSKAAHPRPGDGTDDDEAVGVADGLGVGGRFWGFGASGNEIGINATSRPDLIKSVRPMTDAPCPICAYATTFDGGVSLSDAIEAMVANGSMADIADFIAPYAPELCTDEIIARHMNHGIKDPTALDRHRVQTLLATSYNMACALGSHYAMKVNTGSSEMCVANRHNITGYSTAVGLVIKLIAAKRKMQQGV